LRLDERVAATEQAADDHADAGHSDILILQDNFSLSLFCARQLRCVSKFHEFDNQRGDDGRLRGSSMGLANMALIRPPNPKIR